MRALAKAIVITSLLVGCSNGEEKNTANDAAPVEPEDTGTPTTPGVLATSGLDGIPFATEPVVTSDALSADQSAEVTAFDGGTGTIAIDALSLTAASTGVLLGEETTSSMFSGKSYGSCEMVNRSRGFLHEAATGDGLKCELGLFARVPELKDIFDGEFHIIEDEDRLIKIKIEGNQEKVTGMTVYTCEEGVQGLYLRSSIDSSTNAYTYTAKRTGEPDNPQVDRYYASISVTGTVDDDGSFIGIKVMDNTTSNEFSSGAVSFNRYQVVQSAKNVFFQGVQQQTDMTDPDRFAAFFEILDRNSEDDPFSLSKYAIGDGAIAISRAGDAAIVQGWKGDTSAVDGTVPQVERIAGKKTDLPQAEEPQPFSFAGDEAWDCSGEPEFEITDTALIAAGITETDFAACDGFMLPQDSYIQCHQIADMTATE